MDTTTEISNLRMIGRKLTRPSVGESEEETIGSFENIYSMETAIISCYFDFEKRKTSFTEII